VGDDVLDDDEDDDDERIVVAVGKLGGRREIFTRCVDDILDRGPELVIVDIGRIRFCIERDFIKFLFDDVERVSDGTIADGI
jgi:hypothetical protein